MNTRRPMMLVFIAIILCIVRNIQATPLPMAKPGCPDKCGNVTIPYPFGIGSSCYYNEWYSITCNNTNSNPVLTKFDLEVLQISIGLRQVRVNSPMVINCTTTEPIKTTTTTTWTSTNLGGSPYSFSTLGNVFVPVHCGATSFFNGQDKIMAYCGSNCDFTNYAFSLVFGKSICLTDLPFRLSVFSVNITQINGTCSYVFMVDSNYLTNFDLSQPQLSVLPIAKNGRYIPVILDWVYEYLPASSVNVSNPNCNSQSDGSYVCYCPLGQGGNPYLPNGCQVVEECASCKGDCFVNSDDSTLFLCSPKKKSRGRLVAVILGLSVGIGLLVWVLGCYWLCGFLKRKKEIKQKAKNFKRNGGFLLQKQMSSKDGVIEKAKVFSVKELETATDHFNENRILGHGGQGTVYKGMLTDGRIIAVKKSKKVDESQLEPFINEVVILSQINHRNVVKLLGCCLETEVPLLVYEFIPNGTLSQHIHHPSEEFHISWKMRLQIAAESSGAIAYLHSSSSFPIYHRDIKSSNILLDEKYRAKVSDFGTSRTITVDETHLTTQIRGTFGYLDPEYFQSNQFTEKSDVYSFGVVLVELLTSKMPISQSKEWRSLTTEFLFMMENSRLVDILDRRVLKEGKKEEIMVVANLAKECLNLNGKHRPTMKEVAMVLEGLTSPNGTSPIYQMSRVWSQVTTDISEVDTGPGTSSDGNSFFVDGH